ncbi:unnamed protein product [Clonostachys rosea]|uniref:Gfd2/YDR514C-like C-terminal domain-containing protein n=1 Tax=Bionectria ochroleuca TaxID=29856 RepID=A0ABY6V2S3_BIOOC|nr:unnamed protein product [Clonostachys rosea]
MPSLPRLRTGISVAGPHTGILREENIALRQIFGYHTDGPNITELNVPEIGQDLPGIGIKDVLLLAFDVDIKSGEKKVTLDQRWHIGVSTFDTRCLLERLDESVPSPAITSYHFLNINAKPIKTRPFLWGETESLALPAISSRIQALIKGRTYVLVMHGADMDCKFLLNNLNADLVGEAGYIMDTVKAAQFPLGLYYRYSLERLLEELGIPYANLHVAGNDAHFALRALMMIAVRDFTLFDTFMVKFI